LDTKSVGMGNSGPSAGEIFGGSANWLEDDQIRMDGNPLPIVAVISRLAS